MNILDLETDNITEPLAACVCVIGSGPAGAIVAAELAKKKIDVLLLEAGGRSPDFSNESISNINIFSDVTDLRFGWSRQFGGASNLWAGRTYPLEEADFKKRSWVPDSGWPFPLDTLEPYYQNASKLLDIPGYQFFKNREGANIQEEVFNSVINAETGLEANCFQWAKAPFNSSVYLKGIAKQHPSLRILLNASVGRLIEKTDATSVDTVQVVKTDGSLVNIKARYFVLAGGGIETPRLLLNSNQISPAGIGNEYDNVGRYFSTHPKADMAAIVLNKSVSTSNALFMDCPLEKGSYRYGISSSMQIQEKFELLNHYVQLSPLLEYQASQAFEVLKNTKILQSGLIDRNKLLKGFLPGIGKIAYEAISRIARLQPRTKTFTLRGFLDQYPNRENRIMLSNDQKADGTNKANISWCFSEKDKSSVLNFFSYLDKVLQEKEIGRVEYSGLKKTKDWPLIGIHSHFMGTTRMGEDKKTSVTDANARVHGSSNLYIAGPSLFPTYGFANPFLTISALSIRLGEHLAKQINKN
ncbi:MAG: GMC family oxidoreductase [Hyphomicrobiales bacterium]